MTGATALAFAHEHREGLALFIMAVVVSMHEKLPWPFSRVEVLEWGYEWLHKSLLTFISLRGPTHTETSIQTENKAVDNKGDAVESKKTVMLSSSLPETPPNSPPA